MSRPRGRPTGTISNFRASAAQKANTDRLKRRWRMGPPTGPLCRVCGTYPVKVEGGQCRGCGARTAGKSNKKTWRIPQLNKPPAQAAGSWWLNLSREEFSAKAKAEADRMIQSGVAVTPRSYE
jgi:hypothetical protein